MSGATLLAGVLAAVWLATAIDQAKRADAQTYIETPVFEARVAAGDLPPIADRLPTVPRVIEMDGKKRVAGHHGGRW
ncbi:uncharacterized protein METZ01_LOCUS513772, partial [marine metagenome]